MAESEESSTESLEIGMRFCAIHILVSTLNVIDISIQRIEREHTVLMPTWLYLLIDQALGCYRNSNLVSTIHSAFTSSLTTKTSLRSMKGVKVWFENIS